MESDNLLVFVAIVAVAFALAGTVVTYNSISNFRDFLTGFSVTEDGVVNVTIMDLAAIEIISAGGTEEHKNITWGAGAVNVTGGHTYAILATNGTVTGGNWSAITGGFIVRNIGNVNVDLQIHSTPAVASFIGGTGPLFQYNISDYINISCLTFDVANNTYINFPTEATTVCSGFKYPTIEDELRIDVLLKIPSDSAIGTRNSTVVLTYSSSI